VLRTDLVADYFRGLGDPIRLRIRGLLRRDEEPSVGELVHRHPANRRSPSPRLSALVRLRGTPRWPNRLQRHRRSALERMLELAGSLLADNAEHIAACCRIERSVP
jgi:DNA-binding transcriptional ArsR family regulator